MPSLPSSASSSTRGFALCVPQLSTFIPFHQKISELTEEWYGAGAKLYNARLDKQKE
jgi:hypothetical protein